MSWWREKWCSQLLEDLLSKTKARITPRLRQETFPRAGDSGFRLCRCILYHNFGLRRNGENFKITADASKSDPSPLTRRGVVF